jgi:hypothetical protein
MQFVNFMNSTAGRAIRVLAGLALMAVGAAVGGTTGVILAVVGLVPLAAGAFGLCLAAPLFHVPFRAGGHQA